VIFFVRKKNDRESFLYFLQATLTHFMRFLLLLRLEKNHSLFLFSLYMPFFQNGLLFQDPYVAGFQVTGWWNCCWSGRLAHGRKLSAHTAAERRRKSEIVFLFRFFYSNKSRLLLQRNSVVKFSH